ncbi:MAG: CAP domain-containing protein [Pseudomonadota bacterium]
MLGRRTLLGAFGALALARPAGATISQDILKTTNTIREAQRLPRLNAEARLAAAAQGHADTMARLGELSHSAGGTNLAGRVLATGYVFSRLAENIAYRTEAASDVATAQAIMEQWMGSPGHQANILDNRLAQIGVGVARGDGRVYAVQVFGTPA